MHAIAVAAIFAGAAAALPNKGYGYPEDTTVYETHVETVTSCDKKCHHQPTDYPVPTETAVYPTDEPEVPYPTEEPTHEVPYPTEEPEVPYPTEEPTHEVPYPTEEPEVPVPTEEVPYPTEEPVCPPGVTVTVTVPAGGDMPPPYPTGTGVPTVPAPVYPTGTGAPVPSGTYVPPPAEGAAGKFSAAGLLAGVGAVAAFFL